MERSAVLVRRAIFATGSVLFVPLLFRSLPVCSSKYEDLSGSPADLSGQYRLGMERHEKKEIDAFFREPHEYYSLDEKNRLETADGGRKRGSSERRRRKSPSTTLPGHRILSRMTGPLSLRKSFPSPTTAWKLLLVGILVFVAVSVSFTLHLSNILHRCLQLVRGISREAEGLAPRNLADSGDVSTICDLVTIDMPGGPPSMEVDTSSSQPDHPEADRAAERRDKALQLFLVLFPTVVVAFLALFAAFASTGKSSALLLLLLPAVALLLAAFFLTYWVVGEYQRGPLDSSGSGRENQSGLEEETGKDDKDKRQQKAGRGKKDGNAGSLSTRF